MKKCKTRNISCCDCGKKGKWKIGVKSNRCRTLIAVEFYLNESSFYLWLAHMLGPKHRLHPLYPIENGAGFEKENNCGFLIFLGSVLQHLPPTWAIGLKSSNILLIVSAARNCKLSIRDWGRLNHAFVKNISTHQSDELRPNDANNLELY